MSRAYISAALRREVTERSGNCCEYCRIAQTDIFFAFEIDHIIAEKHGGPTQTENLCLSCPDCNAFKGSDVASVDWLNGTVIVPLYHPREHTWEDHFRVDMATGRIEALSPQGRVTIFLLHLNDDERITDRKLLIDADRYPCS
ncbi:MAG: HNH endonuclease [Anaerolineae bacterium]|nr:HNH endonuclease [Anaerolineae bacterium]